MPSEDVIPIPIPCESPSEIAKIPENSNNTDLTEIPVDQPSIEREPEVLSSKGLHEVTVSLFSLNQSKERCKSQRQRSK